MHVNGKDPRKRIESILEVSQATFEKHVYGKEKKRSLKPLEDLILGLIFSEVQPMTGYLFY